MFFVSFSYSCMALLNKPTFGSASSSLFSEVTISCCIQALFDDLRAKIQENAHLAFADHEVESWWDATRGSGSGSRISSGPALPVTADCNHIMFWTRQGAIVSIRASGTEPKIKVRSVRGSPVVFAAFCFVASPASNSCVQHYIEFADASSEAQAQDVCDRLKEAVLQQVFQQERFKLL